MTTINRDLARETAAAMRSGGKLRPIIVIFKKCTPQLIYFRLKGTRTEYVASIAPLCLNALRGHLNAAKAERAKARKERAKERSR